MTSDTTDNMTDNMKDDASLRDMGVRVGLEVHQQLDTGRKLFCSCVPSDPHTYAATFRRRLYPSKGELGQVDPAALFEGAKSMTIEYCVDPASSCLVEQDEEPPHDLDPDALQSAVIIAKALHSEVFGEIFPMRKTVVDGSNTTGFQRTMLISQGGHYMAGDTRIGIQSVCLEEDAAKNLGKDGPVGRYGLERLGIPLVEIATEPFEADAGQVRHIALALGRILRATRRVRRGLGTIRQDVNISIASSNTVVEVKGIQQLDSMRDVITYEAHRQHGLLTISEKIRRAGGSYGGHFDVTDALAGCKSRIIMDAVSKNVQICAMLWKKMDGLFGFSPHPDVRLGRDVAELARSFGIGGIFHSDELPGYGIEDGDIRRVRDAAGASPGDAFLLLAVPASRTGVITGHIVSRIMQIAGGTIPADTRMATQSGQTRFLRPRPGSARMYPETDILPATITDEFLQHAGILVPVSWDEAVSGIQKKYGLNAQLAEQVFDSAHLPLFERVCEHKNSSPNFVASSLLSTITGLERRGLDRSMLSDDIICDIFSMLHDGSISKESVEMMFSRVMSGELPSEVLKSASSEAVSEEELDAVLQRIVDDNITLIQNQGERASGPLMGIAMKGLRGRTSGQKVSSILQEKIRLVKKSR